MRPYFAIIKDSFREAIASRVLLVLLIIICLMLAAMVPFSYYEKVTIDVLDRDIGDPLNWQAMILRLREAAVSEEKSPGKHIVSVFDEKYRERLMRGPSEGGTRSGVQVEVKPEDKPEEKKDSSEDSKRNEQLEFGLFDGLQENLNKALRKKEFYDAASWREGWMGEEAITLNKKGIDNLSPEELGRFNRLALEAAYRDLVQVSPATSFSYTFFGYKLDTISIFQGRADTKDRFDENVLGWVRFLLAWVVGAVGVFLAILVTASIVPDTFDPGSLHLLLSKPITRSMLFLSKFGGACFFISLSACLLLGGGFLILGIRFGIWHPRLLLCIPIYVFVFAVYFSISALAGLVWRSPIVSIACGILFWIICFTVGYIKYWVQEDALSQTRIVKIVPAEKQTFGITELHSPRVWDGEQKAWQEVFSTEEQRQLRRVQPYLRLLPIPIQFPSPVGMYFDEKTQRLVAIEGVLRQGVGFAVKVTYAAAPKWEHVEGPTPPMGTMAFFPEGDGKYILVASDGAYRFDAANLKEQKSGSLFGFNLGGTSIFERVTEADAVQVDRPSQAAFDAKKGLLTIYSRGKLTTLSRGENGKFSLAKLSTLPGMTEDQAHDTGLIMSMSRDCVVLAFQTGRIVCVEPMSHEIQSDAVPAKGEQPRSIAADGDSETFAVLFHNGKVQVFSDKGKSAAYPSIKGQGDISAIRIEGGNRLLVCDRTDRLSEYELASFKSVKQLSPSLSAFEATYRYAILPIYTLFPKPGEIEKTVRYLLLEKENDAQGAARFDLSLAPKKVEPWAPVFSSGVFLVVMLALSCFYIERQEY
jgi:ABC-type transport system involved in multi-copper enzyme maturation permease subunit